MITIENSQFPAEDDINIESLEYLFGPAVYQKEKKIPWVEIISDSEQFEVEKIKLQERIDFLELRNQVTHSKLERACIFIGYLQGLIHERDEQLKVLPDLRFKAAQSIAYRLDAERSKERIQELEAELQRQLKGSKWKAEEILNLPDSTRYDDAAITILLWLGLSGISGVLFSICSLM